MTANTIHPADEQLLVRRAKEGDQSAFIELHDRHAMGLLSFLTTRCPARVAVDDIAQTAWLKVWSNLATFDGRHFRAWLFTIAKRCLIDAQRKTNRIKDLDPDSDLIWTDGIEEEDERLVALRECLKQLDGSFVATLHQTKILGICPAQLAAKEGIAPSTIYTRVDRGKRQLAECIENKLR